MLVYYLLIWEGKKEEKKTKKDRNEKLATNKTKQNKAATQYFTLNPGAKRPSKYYQELSSLSYWTRPTFKIFGRPVKAARQTCSFGSNPNKVYKYSGTTADVDSIEYPPSIKEIK